MKILHIIGFILVMVGAINWGLVGLGMLAGGADWNLVHLIFGQWMPLEAIIYVLVGVAGVWIIVTHRKECKVCSASM